MPAVSDLHTTDVGEVCRRRLSGIGACCCGNSATGWNPCGPSDAQFAYAAFTHPALVGRWMYRSWYGASLPGRLGALLIHHAINGAV